MMGFRSDALNPGVRGREVFAWAMYDFANSGYTTVVITAVFAAYFVGGVAQGADWATLAWTLALSISYAIVMLTMPALGAWMDRKACKKRFLMMTTLACVLATAALAWVGPGQLWLAMLLVILSNTFYTYGESTTAAFLPELATQKGMGTVSGWGWALGYVGGMLTLGICLGYVLWAQSQGQSANEFVPVTMLITAAVYGLAALVTFAGLRERALPQSQSEHPIESVITQGFAQLKRSWDSLKNYPDLRQLLWCIVAYQAGVAVAISLAAIYAEQVIGFAQQETMILIFALNIAAMGGAFFWGYLQDHWGHKQALAVTLVGWIATCLIAAVSTSKGQFWWAAGLAGVCMGASQSAGRAMAGLFSPKAQLAEFMGLWSFAVRLASVLGPLSYGLITWVAGGNQRLAIAATGLMFVLGLLLLARVNVERGQSRAELVAACEARFSRPVSTVFKP